MTSIEVTAKKVDDAIKQGLEQLGATLDEVNVEVIDSGGLLRKAKVRLTLERESEQKPDAPAAEENRSVAKPQRQPAAKPQEPAKPQQPKREQQPAKPQERQSQPKQTKPQNSVAKPQERAEQKPERNREERDVNCSSEEYRQAMAQAKEFVVATVQKMGFDSSTVEAKENGDIVITAPEGDDSLIIGRHGETLSSLTFLAETLGRAEKHHINIVVDCNGYRERRAASLSAMARRRADECVNKRRKIKLEPMERVDRRTVHNALNDDNRVTTSSEGKEPYRCVVILPKK